MTELDRIHAAARAELMRTPSTRRWWVDALVSVVVGVMVAAGGLLVMGLNEAQHASAFARWATAGWLGVVLTGGSVLGLKPGSRAGPMGALGLVVGCVVAVVAAGSGVGPEVTVAQELRCGGLEWVLSAVPMVTAVLALRRFDFDWLRTSVTAAAAGAAGALVLHLHCPNGALAHLASFHALPWAALVAVAVVVRRRLPSSSFAP